jgi:protein O-GlcNAc transferase
LTAEASSRRRLAVSPDSAEAWVDLGLVAADARITLRRAVALAPATAAILALTGETARRRGMVREAQRWLRQAGALAPADAATQVNLGALLSEIDAAAAGEAASLRALALDPADWLPCYNLAIALRIAAPERARAHLRRGIGRHPLVMELRQLLVRLETDLSRKVPSARHLLVLAPADLHGWAALGGGELIYGEADAALRAGRRAAMLAPDELGLVSSSLLNMSYAESARPRDLVAAHRAFGMTFPECPRPPKRLRPAGEPIRVGLISGDFRWHSTAFLLPPLLRNRDRRRWRAHLYSNVGTADAMTGHFREMSDGWTDIAGVGDADVVRAIGNDAIDILIDLNGHTAGHRLSVFARRAAPVQATWLDYPGSTGLRQVDYAITDIHHSPPGTEGDYVETVVRLPHNRFCYEPPAAPEVTPLPAATSGRVTFGSFNSVYKISPGCIGAWARILAAVPGSRLRLVAPPTAAASLRSRFAVHGIGADRVELLGSVPHFELMARYGDIDLALDTFPYSGGLTTCEALWMGVPVVTFPGDRTAGRHSTAHLRTVGLDDLVAADRDGYVDRAISLARDLGTLATLRRDLRGRMAASPLIDGPAFARDFADLLETLV